MIMVVFGHAAIVFKKEKEKEKSRSITASYIPLDKKVWNLKIESLMLPNDKQIKLTKGTGVAEGVVGDACQESGNVEQNLLTFAYINFHTPYLKHRKESIDIKFAEILDSEALKVYAATSSRNYFRLCQPYFTLHPSAFQTVDLLSTCLLSTIRSLSNPQIAHHLILLFHLIRITQRHISQ
jgi:hypothetical protein